jgi:hypothetical protein
MSLPLDRKYYAKEPCASVVPNPKLEDSKKKICQSARNFQESKRRLSILKGEKQIASIDKVIQKKTPKTCPANDDDVDVWNCSLRAEPSLGNFTAVSADDENDKHVVPCDDPECNRCDLLSVVSDFDDEDAEGELLKPEARMADKLSSLRHRVEKTIKSQQRAETTKKPKLHRLNTREPEAQEVRYTVHETRPVKVEPLIRSQETLNAYMKSYTIQGPSSRSTGQDSRLAQPAFIRPEENIAPKQYLEKDVSIRSPIDTFIDMLKYSPQVVDARGRRLSLSQVKAFKDMQPDSPRDDTTRPAALAGQETKVTHKIATEQSVRVEEITPQALTSSAGARDSLHKSPSVRRSNSRASSRAKTPPPAPSPTVPPTRKHSFSERMTKLDQAMERAPSRFSKKSATDEDGEPRFGRGSRPPVSYRASGI